MFYSGSVSPPRQPANKKRVVPQRSAAAATMEGGDEKTTPGSPKKSFDVGMDPKHPNYVID
jgi:hypothetical protein